MTVQPFCVDEQTEILTQRGWITHHSLEAGDVVLSLDPKTREILWESAISVHRSEYDGPLIRWKSQKIDALTTPGHRWLIGTKRRQAARGELAACPECGTTAGKRGPFRDSNAVRTHRARQHGILTRDVERGHRAAVFTGEPVFCTTEELASRYDYIITGGGTPACFAPAPLHADEFVELIGWVITEGRYQHGPEAGQGVVLAQDIQVNPRYTARIRRIAAPFRAEGATVSEYIYGDDTRRTGISGGASGRPSARPRQSGSSQQHSCARSRRRRLGCCTRR